MILRYPGGKNRKTVRNKILSKAPFFKFYREPFCGSAAIFFNIDKSVDRWINDIDCHLINLYKALKEYPIPFIESCRQIEPEKEGEPLDSARVGGKAIYNARLKAVFDSFANNNEMDQALRYFFINRTVWAGRVNYDIPSRMYFSNPSGWNIVKTKKLEEAASACKDAVITCESYKRLLEEKGEDVWIYVDPPYVVNTELDKNSQLYKHNFTEKDHIDLAENIKKCNHKVCISYDDNEMIRDLYQDFKIYEEEWKYCGTSSAENQSKTKKTGKELLICNY